MYVRIQTNVTECITLLRIRAQDNYNSYIVTTANSGTICSKQAILYSEALASATIACFTTLSSNLIHLCNVDIDANLPSTT